MRAPEGTKVINSDRFGGVFRNVRRLRNEMLIRTQSCGIQRCKNTAEMMVLEPNGANTRPK